MKQPKLLTVFTAFVIALALAACSGEKEEVILNAEQETAMSERLAPDGEVTLAGEVTSAPAAGSGGSRSGEEIYNSKCTTCHTSGAAGAPILGAAKDWTERVGKGIDVLYTSSISGFKGMPPKGLCFDCSDDELKAAVDYMVDNSK
jgi:cytochrome c5